MLAKQGPSRGLMRLTSCISRVGGIGRPFSRKVCTEGKVRC